MFAYVFTVANIGGGITLCMGHYLVGLLEKSQICTYILDVFIENTYNYQQELESDRKLVLNDYEIEGDAKVDLLTGANMAGKSTFLRTLGGNMILSMIGAPGCAEEFKFKPIKLFSRLRTVDSLQENESFFYAELKRLKTMISLYEKNNDYFFLFDEILKGTNSKDQHTGSLGLIKKIISLRGKGIIATHDVSLCELESELTAVENYYFDAEISEDELHFDYALKKGVCKNMNASFLLKKMEIV